jgi:hypothetical protein
MRKDAKNYGFAVVEFVDGLHRLQQFQFGSNLDSKLIPQYGTVANNKRDYTLK